MKNLFSPRSVALALGLWLTSLPAIVSAHFVWLHVEPGHPDGPVVHIRFSEEASTNEPALLGRLQGIQLWQLSPGGEPSPLTTRQVHDTLVASLLSGNTDVVIIADHDLGVLDKGGSTFRLRYAAKTGPAVTSPAWSQIEASQKLPLDVTATQDGEAIVIKATWQGVPAVGNEVVVLSSTGVEQRGVTDEAGQFRCKIEERGEASIRVRHIDATAGELNGKAYPETRYYTTLTLPLGNVESLELPVIPQVVTSFGAASVDGVLYTYGGHKGEAHEYIAGDQDHVLRRLDIAAIQAGEARAWETVAEGPPLQGLALVPHGSSVIRVGGFAARNSEDQPQDLHSTAEVARYSVTEPQWQPLPSLPEARSSHDAIVLHGRLYVIGGWAMAGPNNTTWHSTAWSLNLDAPEAQWEPIPDVPFRRRALALAAHHGAIYAIGGMEESGGPSTRVDRFDPQTQTWSEAPALQGKPMSGFGCSAFATGGKLYVTTVAGELQCLNEAENRWEIVGKLDRSRFFHRMLPLDQQHLLIVGGGHMEMGKYEEVDIVPVETQE